MTQLLFSRERIDYPQVSTALFNLRPGAQWCLKGEELYENIEWHKDNVDTIPTKEEIEQEIERIKKDSAMKYLRMERDKRLYETDWWAVNDRVMSQEQKDYRQALRNITSTAEPILDPNDPTMISNVDWPIKPEV